MRSLIVTLLGLALTTTEESPPTTRSSSLFGSVLCRENTRSTSSKLSVCFRTLDLGGLYLDLELFLVDFLTANGSVNFDFFFLCCDLPMLSGLTRDCESRNFRPLISGIAHVMLSTTFFLVGPNFLKCQNFSIYYGYFSLFVKRALIGAKEVESNA